MAPKLSVAFPTFNRVQWLEGAIASVLVPGLDCELVVIDNGSTDGTAELLEAWCKRDSRLRVMTWDYNIGCEGYPCSIEACTGEYVALFADDDEMLPGGLLSKVAYLDAHPEVGMVFTPVRFMNEAGEDQGELEWGRIAEQDLPGDPEFFDKLILGNVVPLGTAMWRRALSPYGIPMRNAGFAPSGDWHYWLTLARQMKVAFLREPTTRIRLHAGQATEDHGVRAGGFVDANLNIWRYWMLEANPPYIPSPQAWQALLATYARMLKATYKGDAARFAEGLYRLKAVLEAQAIRLNQAAPPEEAGTEPEAFFHEPDWTGSQWVEVLLSFCEAFAPGEAVALVLPLDGPGAPAAGEAREMILGIVARTGRDRCPDVVLTEGPEELLATLRRYPHVHCVAGGQGLEGPLGRRFNEARKRLTGKEKA